MSGDLICNMGPILKWAALALAVAAPLCSSFGYARVTVIAALLCAACVVGFAFVPTCGAPKLPPADKAAGLDSEIRASELDDT